MTKVELEHKYVTMLNKDLCKELNISHATLISLLKRYNIKLKGPGYWRKNAYKITIEE